MAAAPDYRRFLESKIRLAEATGFEIADADVHPRLLGHQRAVVRWAVRGGCRAIFALFGLGKTGMQLEVLRLCLAWAGGRGLIVAPLGVRQEFFREARALGIPLTFVRSLDEAPESGLCLTNYEAVRDGRLDPAAFTAVSLDEASVLRSFGSKTYQTFLPLFEAVRFRFVATATPSPNRYKEIIHYAGFLGVMDTGQALTRFFQRNSEKAGDLTLYPHKEDEFWLWCASWAAFLQRPSDLGFSDEGYDLPPLTVRWHEVETNLADAGAERDGQGILFRAAAVGLANEARERRDTLPARIAKLRAILDADPDSHRLIWHDLEAERHAIQAAVPDAVAVYGTQDLDEREAAIVAFSDGAFRYLAAKPVIAGSGCNFQRHCHKAVFVGVSHKFNDFIQAIHRIQRFQQAYPVEIDIIHSEADREVVRDLQAKWARHEEMAARMAAIIRTHGLHRASLAGVLTRSLGVTRAETIGDGWQLAHNDCVEECRHLADDSLDLVVTSIPFSNHYEYTPSYNDFGHTDDDRHFFEQMDYLTPQLLRALKPGRLACIHVKDRILFGSATGTGTPTVNPFHAKTLFHYMEHGFLYMGMIFIDTDVVRENNQTYRLGWTENGKDSTKMGVGSPEFVLLFRKLPSDRSKAYADERVTKDKPLCLTADGHLVAFDDRLPPQPGTGYSRARWQVDAHARWRSSGDRLMSAEELARLSPEALAASFRAASLREVYDHEAHVRLGEELAQRFALPATFLSLWPGSNRPDVWTDIARMVTLNTDQASKGREKHVCPLQLDVVDRLIRRYSLPGELVFDPFAGLGTVPLRALKAGRRGRGCELNPGYFADSVRYLRAAEQGRAALSLFDALDLAASATPQAAE
ncbi:DNA methyltransferase [Methylobacterium oryzihabitans]|uniref:site-specific DNA-methyltransferase (adenine-specific) n=1 Tax=Methylobacterium oryzihabitans TaxID=2499852 RepID=A0A437NT26_9HYPH|nr:DNA methyltransferase [Methylobacterium oryzihabitans]RVU13147.1 DNA methylase N-4 [Methylobacterium oryzihabitans]